jgi:hypothetical protein
LPQRPTLQACALPATRPAFQRNDYLMWINKAARTDMKDARRAQMLDELPAGDVYVRMRRGPR